MRALRLGWILLSGLALAAACATGHDTTFEEPAGGDGGGDTSTATGGTGGGTGGGAGGGTTTTTGTTTGTTTTTTTTELPCGIDCGTIETDDCHVAVCDEETKNCKVQKVGEGTPCDDGQFCTVDDKCQDGICVGGPPNDCGQKPAVCQQMVCNENTKSCSSVVQPDNTPCISPDLCKPSAVCQLGVCVGYPKDCSMAPVPDDCHVSVCNPQNGNCEPVPGNEGQPCMDPNDLCALEQKCAAGVCQAATSKDCSQLTMGCNLGVCDKKTGQCTTQAVMQGQNCDDLDACTTGETCNNGTCGGGMPVTQCQNGDLCCPQGCTDQNDNDCGVPKGCKKTAIPGIAICISNDKVNTYNTPSHCAACTEKGLTNACVDQSSCLQGFTNKIIEDLYLERTGMTCTVQQQQGPSCGWGEIMTPSYQPPGVCPSPQDCTTSINWANCKYGVGGYNAYIYGVCNYP